MKRPVTALALADITPGVPPTPKPEITWIDPRELLIDEEYQRSLSDPSVKLIRRIAERWDWRRFKPPIAAWTAEGLEIIDGQHSAIGAATHGGIAEIPVVIVEAIERVDRAHAFIGHNKDRLIVTAPQMHHAALAAGDEAALKVARVCAAAEVEVLRLPPARAIYKARSTIAVAAVRAVVAAEEESDATWILRTLADAGLAPITASHIRALQHLTTAPEFSEVDRETLARTIAASPIGAVEKDAREHSATHCVPTWRGLAAVWFRAAVKKRPRKAEPAREGSDQPDMGIPVTEQSQILSPVTDDASAGAEVSLVEEARRRRHAEYVENARKAVPATMWSRPGGATVKTG